MLQKIIKTLKRKYQGNLKIDPKYLMMRKTSPIYTRVTYLKKNKIYLFSTKLILSGNKYVQ